MKKIISAKGYNKTGTFDILPRFCIIINSYDFQIHLSLFNWHCWIGFKR